MTNKQNPKFQELVAKLREIFQIDRPELDFGIYRILNARAGEINDYLENRLAEKVQAALSAGSAASAQQLQTDLDEAIKQAQALGANPDDLPKVKDLRVRLKEATGGSSEQKNAVFSHLLAFFSRYYEQGDFISQRRYKGDTYAIPYAGEEVMLHWANKDQYYTKSGENFSNYSFKLEDGRTVHFRLASADTAKDNRKDNDKERRFSLVEAKTVTRLDENVDEYEEELVPVEEASGSDCNQELIIRFEYAAQPKGTKQEALVTKAVEAVLADAAVKARWLALGNRAPTEKAPQRTLLEKHLSDYTTKNTADYFIHKDLGGFLRRELDFYIKNEVMHLDDVQNAGAFADIEKNLRMIQCLRSIALELITFLAQLEDFQKKLWLKKKFVVSSHYCITLDRVPEALWPEVVANEKQWDEWRSLGVWEHASGGSLDDLKARPQLTVDTRHFSKSFTRELARTDIEADIDGIVVHSDNFHASRVLRERYVGTAKCLYMDPPYNTGGDGFPYKDSYRDSSWGAMIFDRIQAVGRLASDKGALFVSLDDRESHILRATLHETGWQRFGEFVWKTRNTDNRVSTRFSVDHESIHACCRPGSVLEGRTIDRSNFKNPDNDPRGDYTTDPLTGKANAADRPNLHYTITNEETGDKYPPDPDFGWITDERGFEELRKQKLVYWPTNPRTGKPRKKRFLKDTDPKAPISSVGLSISQGEGNQGLADLMGYKALNFPKPVSIIASVIDSATLHDDLIVDCFAGSGTTAHAVVQLNRQQSGSHRKYLLMEQGEYFNTLLVPRLKKVIYSANWSKGRPTSNTSGISHSFKIIKLESYEDTLNNLQLRRTSAQGDLLNTLPQQAKDDYLLNYLLDLESHGSLLSVEDFKKPFDYTLNVAVDSAGAFEPRNIDLVETFNYLIGLRVKHIDAQPERGFVTVTGTLPSNETCLVLWRDCDVLDYEGISKLCDKLAINPADNEFDVVYINGDHNIPTVLTQTAEEGGATRVLKLRQTEPEFLDRMFSVEEI